MDKRYKIIVSGLVQGVGYRYFCHRKAAEYNLKGYVRNLFTGEVELEVEGNKNMISDFIIDLKIGPFGASVKSISSEELPFKNEFTEFRIT